MQISYEQCESCHNEIANIIENMHNIIEEIKAQNDSLKNDDIWNSPGSSHYVYLFKEVLKGFDEMYEQLKRSNVFLEQSYSNYKELDAQIMRQLGF